MRTPSPVLLALLLAAGPALAITRAEFELMIESRSPENPRPLPAGIAPPRARAASRASFWPGTDTVIRADFVCNDDATGGCTQQGPRIKIDRQGNFAIAWYEFRDGDADAWFQRFDSLGNPLGPNERLNTDVTMGWQGDPAPALGADGRVWFSWEDRRDIGNSDLFGQRLDASGGRVGDNFRVSDSVADGDQSFSDLYINPDNVALVAWDDRRNGITGDIFAQFLAADGSPLGGNFRVNDDPVGLANQYAPAVAGDDSGRFVVAWMDGRGRNASDWNIFLQRFGPNRSRLGTNVQVTTDESIQWSPRIGVGRSGRFAGVWDDRRNGNLDVYAQLYDAAGAPIGTNFRVNDNSGTSDQYGAAAAVNRFDELLLAWTDTRSGNEDVYARRYDPAGNPLGPGFPVSDVSAGNQAFPTAAARPDGGWWLTWADTRSGDLDIYCRRLNRDGTAVGASFRVNDDQASSLQRVSSIGMDARGSSCVTWEDERNGPADIYRCVFDSSGQMLGPNLRLNDDGPGAAPQYYSAAAGGSSRFLTAWTDGRNNWDIYAQFLDGSGQPIGGNFLVNSDTAGDFQWYPYCAMDTANNSLIAWTDYRGALEQMYLRRYDSSGSPVGPEFRAADSSVTGIYGSVAMSPSGRSVAAWMDFRDGESDIYCQAFRADGTRVGANVKANDDFGNYNGYPSCAIRDDGSFAVAWEDTRNDCYEVWCQWFDSTGSRVGGNVRVSDGPPQSQAYSPSCALAPDGRLAVMYNDERDFPGNPQIYCQRFGSDRSRIGLSQRINDANLFPKNHHWTVAQSIAARHDRIAFAWTDNRRHQGWDIFAKLTDWELVGISEPTPPPQSAGLSPGRMPTLQRNPARISSSVLPGPSSVFLYDACGRLVRQSAVGNRPSNVELGRLTPGAYFVLVRSAQVTTRHKVVVE